MKVIAFVGMPGAGKTEASNVARQMGIPVVIMGDVIREEAEKRGLPPTDENIGGVASQLRKEEGMDAIARRCIPKIKAYEGKSDVAFPTEPEEKVRRAIESIFPGARLRMIKQKGYVDRLEGTAGLDRLHELLRKQKILDTARSAMYRGLKDDEISFELSKQAAYMGQVNFLDHEVALGGIYVTIRYKDPQHIIDWLAPETREGKPLEEIEL